MNNWPSQDSKSQKLYERGLKVLPGGITRLVPWQKPFPVYAAFGSGARVTDVDGTTRVDFLNNFASLIHGHAHPRIVEAVERQLRLGTAFTMPTESEIALAERICERLPSAEHVRYSNSGSEAVMAAVKAARAATGRPAIVKVEGSYHGCYDFVEVSLDPPRESWTNPPSSVGYTPGIPQGVLDSVFVVPFNDPAAAEQVIRRHRHQIAAILLDATPSYLGFPMMTREFADRMRALASEIGALVILDEVISFRLRRGGAQDMLALKPDITVLAKIIGGGFPVGAIAGSRDVMKVFDHRAGRPAVPWSGTFSANPISMTAGAVTLDLLTPDAFKHINGLGERAVKGLNDAFKSAGFPGQATGIGSMFKLHTHNRPVKDFRSQKHSPEETMALLELQRLLVLKGFHVSGQGMGFTSTVMTQEDVDGLCAAVEDSLRQIRHPSKAA